MLFNGFNKNKFPSYSVITPQTGYTFDVRMLSVEETNNLKHALLTPNSAAMHVNKVLWESVKTAPEGINTYEEFLKKLTLLDREAIIYGIYHSTFGNTKDFRVICPKCEQPTDIKFNLDDTFSMLPYPKSKSMKESYKIAKAVEGDKVTDSDIEKAIEEDEAKKIEKLKKKVSGEDSDEDSIINKIIPVELKYSEVTAYIKSPTMWDEEEMLRNCSYVDNTHIDALTETLIIDKFEYINETGHKLELTKREDILKGYETLPLLDKKQLATEHNEQFSKYRINLESTWVCSKHSCRNKNQFYLNVSDQFFRMVQAY
jgi:hypothetical protein